MVVYEPHSKTTYITRAGEELYVLYKHDLLAMMLSGGIVMYGESYYHSQGDSLDIAVSEFARTLDDKRIGTLELDRFRVDLRHAAPFPFFTAKSAGGSQAGRPTVENVELSGQVLRLDLTSEGGRYRGSFFVNLETQALVRSVIDGADYDLHAW